MKESKFAYLVEPIRELLYDYENIISAFKVKNNIKIVGFNYELLPPDILASFGFYYLKLPTMLYGDKSKISDDIFDLYDYLVFQKDDKIKISNESLVYYLESPKGYGEDFSLKLHEQIDDFLKFASIQDGSKQFDLSRLQFVTAQYEMTRKLMRGISGIRKSKPHLLSNRDLFD